MKNGWVVKATRPSNPLADWPWPIGYFPRNVHYKTEAKTLAESVKKFKGTATIEKM